MNKFSKYLTTALTYIIVGGVILQVLHNPASAGFAHVVILLSVIALNLVFVTQTQPIFEASELLEVTSEPKTVVNNTIVNNKKFFNDEPDE